MKYLSLILLFICSNSYAGFGIKRGSGFGIARFDSDALSYIKSDTFTSIEKQAINGFVKDLKAINLIQSNFVNFSNKSSSIIQALYLPVGGKASSHALNLINPSRTDNAFRLTFGGNITHDKYGFYGDNSTGFAETYYTPSVNQGLNNAHFLIWSAYDQYESKYMGSNDVPYTRMTGRWVDNKLYGSLNGGSEKAINITSSVGLYGMIRNTSGHLIMTNNNSWNDISQVATGLSTTSIRFNSTNSTGSKTYCFKQISVASIGLGMSQNAYNAYYAAITKFLKAINSYSIDSTNYIMMHTPTHVRHDASSQRKLPNGNLLCVWGYSDALSEDGSPSVIKGKLSTDNGITWGNEYLIAAVNGSIGSYCPSLEVRNDGTIVLILLVQNSATTSELYQCESTDNGVTFNTPYKIYGEANKYYSPISDRIFITNTGRWLYSFNLNTNGILSSSGGTYVGKLLYSDNQGVTWNISGLTVNGISANTIDLLVVESGIYQLPSNKLVFYSRTRNGYVNMVESIDNGDTWGSPYSSTLTATNATVTIKYISRLGYLVAVRNRNTGVINGVGGRKIMDVLKSTDNGTTWTIIKTLHNAPGMVLFEPTILDLPDKIIIFYSKSDYVSSLNVDLIYTIIP